MQSKRAFASLVAIVLGAVASPTQELPAMFAATRGRAVGAAADAFRRTPRATEFLIGALDAGRDDRLLAIEHLQRMPEASRAAAADLLRVADAPGPEGLAAAIAIGNVAPWWPAERRAEARTMLAARFGATQQPGDRTALSRSWTRAGLAATKDLRAIEAMLAGGDPFQIEFGLHQLEECEAAARPLLPLVRELAKCTQWPVGDDVQGRRRELPCTADWTALIRARLWWALRRIDPSDPAALPFYLERLPKAEAWAQLDFVQMLGRMGAEAAPALPAVTALSRSKDAVLAREAVTVIGMIGVPDAPAVARLRELAQGADKQLAMRARSALRQVGADSPR